MTGGDAPIHRRKTARTVNPQRKALAAQLARLEQQIRTLAAERPAVGSPRERLLEAMQAKQGELQVRLLAFRRARLLRQLPLEQRLALLLAAREAMSYDEIASVLLVPVGTVCSRLSQARERLRQALLD